LVKTKDVTGPCLFSSENCLMTS